MALVRVQGNRCITGIFIFISKTRCGIAQSTPAVGGMARKRLSVSEVVAREDDAEAKR